MADAADRAQPRVQVHDLATFEAETAKPAQPGSWRRWRNGWWEVVMIEDARVYVIPQGR
jgi:hypothetical protein